jgi:hypothetical protein
MLIDVSTFLTVTENLPSWQQMWSMKTSLDPTVFSHDLVRLLSSSKIINNGKGVKLQAAILNFYGRDDTTE